MDPKEAHSQFLARVNQYKMNTKATEERIHGTKDDIERLRRAADQYDNTTEEDTGEAAKYELLQKRDQDMTAFIDKFDESRESIISEQKTVQDTVVALLQHIGRSIEDTEHMPTQESLGEMKDAKTFKAKNLATAEKTMEALQKELKKRQNEIEILRNSEPKLAKELTSLSDAMTKMRGELGGFQDMEGLRFNFDRTQQRLQELRRGYMKRRDAMRQQVQALSAEHEQLKRSLNSHDTARDLDDMEKRLKHYERSIFELREFIEVKSRETDYENIKVSCLSVVDQLNAVVIKRSQEASGAAKYAPY
jgi:chromosome segregation ATPase